MKIVNFRDQSTNSNDILKKAIDLYESSILNLNKRQIANNTINIMSDSIEGGTFIGKRRIMSEWTSNSASSINTDSKRSKRQWLNNQVNITAKKITDGNFIGKRKRQVANIWTNKIQNAKFQGRVNIISNSFHDISMDCSPTGCVNKIG